MTNIDYLANMLLMSTSEIEELFETANTLAYRHEVNLQQFVDDGFLHEEMAPKLPGEMEDE